MSLLLKAPPQCTVHHDNISAPMPSHCFSRRLPLSTSELQGRLLAAYIIPRAERVSKTDPPVRFLYDTHLQTRGRRKDFIPEESPQFIPSPYLVCLIFVFLRAKGRGDVHEFPGLDVIVALFPTMDVTLDSVPIIADHESGPGQCSISRLKKNPSAHRF